MNSRDETIQTLSAHPFFARVPESHLEELRGGAFFKNHPKDSVIFLAGEPAESMYLLVSGRAKVCSEVADRLLTLSFLDAGEPFGELAALDGKPRSTSVFAVEDCVVFGVTRFAFLKFLDAHPEIYPEIVKTLCFYIRRLTDRHEEALCLPVDVRIARLILHLLEAAGERGKNNVAVDIINKQGDLAELLGLRRETVNRQLARWKLQGLVKIDKQQITFVDVASLKEIAQDA